MTDSTKLLIEAVEASGNKVLNPSTLILAYDEGKDFGSIYHDNKMFGEAKVMLANINETDLVADGVRIWRTWNWGEGCK